MSEDRLCAAADYLADLDENDAPASHATAALLRAVWDMHGGTYCTCRPPLSTDPRCYAAADLADTILGDDRA